MSSSRVPLVVAFAAALLLAITAPASAFPVKDLPGCDTYHDNQCVGNTIVTNSSFAANRWFTPPRGAAGYQDSFQDYSHLVGYTHLAYTDATKTAATVELRGIHKVDF